MDERTIRTIDVLRLRREAERELSDLARRPAEREDTLEDFLRALREPKAS